jgi:ABC-2 type transport system permease protein
VMSIMWQMIRANLLSTIRDRRALLMLVLMPVVLTTILSFALQGVFGGKGIPRFHVAVYNADTGQVGRGLQQVLASQSDQFALDVVHSASEGRERLTSGSSDVFVQIPAGFSDEVLAGKTAPVEVESLLQDSTKQTVVAAVVDAYAKQAGIRLYAAKQLGSAAAAIPAPQFDVQSTGMHPVTAGSYYAVGMMVMFLLMNAVNRSEKMVEERQSDRYRRLLVSPASRQALGLGHWVSTTVILCLQGVLLLLAARFLLGISLGPWWQMLLITLSYAIALAGLSVLLGVLVRNRQLMDGLGMVGAQVMALLGGSMYPLYGAPDAIRVIGRCLPNGLALNGLLDSITGTSLANLLWPMTCLVAIGVLLGLVANTRYGRAA